MLRVWICLLLLGLFFERGLSEENHYMNMVNSIARGQSYYTLLGVDDSATAQEIKKAYRQMALKYHPDKNKDPQAKKIFQEIREANEILSHTSLREQYDELLINGIPMMDRYYNRHMHNYGLPEHDIRLVLLVLLVVLTVIKYLSDRSNYYTKRRQVMADPRYKGWARANGYALGEGFRFVDMEAPTWRSLLAVQLVLLPLQIPSLVRYIRRRVYWYRHPPKTRTETEAMLRDAGWSQEQIDHYRRMCGARAFGPDDRKQQHRKPTPAQEKENQTQ